jgi:hypothetical protein
MQLNLVYHLGLVILLVFRVFSTFCKSHYQIIIFKSTRTKKEKNLKIEDYGHVILLVMYFFFSILWTTPSNYTSKITLR